TCPRGACLGTGPSHGPSRRVWGLSLDNGPSGPVWGLSPAVAPGGTCSPSTMTPTVNPPGLFSPRLLAPVPIALAAVAAACFAHGFLRLRRRGRYDHAPWTRVALFAAGLALLLLPLVSPLDLLGDRYLLSAHMLQHVLIGDAGPALILLAIRGPLLLFVIPVG